MGVLGRKKRKREKRLRNIQLKTLSMELETLSIDELNELLSEAERLALILKSAHHQETFKVIETRITNRIDSIKRSADLSKSMIMSRWALILAIFSLFVSIITLVVNYS